MTVLLSTHTGNTRVVRIKPIPRSLSLDLHQDFKSLHGIQIHLALVTLFSHSLPNKGVAKAERVNPQLFQERV